MTTTTLILMIVLPFAISSITLILIKQVKKKEAKTTHKLEPHKKTTKIVSLTVVSSLLILGVSLLFLLKGCDNEGEYALIVVEKDDNKYVYYYSDYFMEKKIEEKETIDITYFSKLMIYSVDDDLYVNPTDIEGLVNILTDNTNFYTYDQVSFQGFVTSKEDSNYDYTLLTKPTEKIGETYNEFHVEIKYDNNTHLIKWENKDDFAPIQNCELKSVWEVSNPYPGKTVGTFRKMILIKLDDLVQLIAPNTSYRYDKEDNLLFISL